MFKPTPNPRSQTKSTLNLTIQPNKTTSTSAPLSTLKPPTNPKACS